MSLSETNYIDATWTPDMSQRQENVHHAWDFLLQWALLNWEYVVLNSAWFKNTGVNSERNQSVLRMVDVGAKHLLTCSIYLVNAVLAFNNN